MKPSLSHLIMSLALLSSTAAFANDPTQISCDTLNYKTENYVHFSFIVPPSNRAVIELTDKLNRSNSKMVEYMRKGSVLTLTYDHPSYLQAFQITMDLNREITGSRPAAFEGVLGYQAEVAPLKLSCIVTGKPVNE